jgi:hypothetical protein
MLQKHEISALGGFAPAARASPVAIVLYYLFGHYRIVPRPPTGDWWHKRGEIMTPERVSLKSEQYGYHIFGG